MYEYNSDKILQRQKVCLKCKSFVTHEKGEENDERCPLCGNVVKPAKSRVAPIGSNRMKKMIKRFFEKAEAKKRHSLADSKQAASMKQEAEKHPSAPIHENEEEGVSEAAADESPDTSAME